MYPNSYTVIIRPMEEDEFEVRNVILTPDNAGVHTYNNPKYNHLVILIGETAILGELVSLEELPIFHEFHIPIHNHSIPTKSVEQWIEAEIDRQIQDFSGTIE